MLLVPTIRHILVLDDDPIMRDLLEALLSLEGFTLTLAQSGEDALGKLRADGSFDLVLTDVQMPGLQGQELAIALREAMPKPALLIGMSGNEPSEETRDRFDAFLSKPFAVQLLRDAIATAKTRRAPDDGLQDAEDGAESGDSDASVVPLDPKIYGSLSAMIAAPQLSNLFAMALIDIEKRHKRIVDAAAEDDLATVQREAHAIKGSCGMIGASELQKLAATIEEGGSPDLVAIAEIPLACVRLRRMLDSQSHTV